ncbi:MAG: polysaccharide-degrading enzyme [Candidatus Margulisiibacteriota bacterium]
MRKFTAKLFPLALLLLVIGCGQPEVVLTEDSTTTTTTSTTTTTAAGITTTTTSTTTTLPGATTTTSTTTTTVPSSASYYDFSPTAGGTLYEVGPGKAYTNIGDVPLESLQAGDVVRVYWRSTPYKEKVLLSGTGTAAAPIVLMGVPNASGDLPVLDGTNATTRDQLRYYQLGDAQRGVVTIGSNHTLGDSYKPSYIIVANLELKSANLDNTFTYNHGSGTATYSYLSNAASIHIPRGDHIKIYNCVLQDSGNGLFAASSAGIEAYMTRDILVEGCYIHNNGVVGQDTRHNVYTEVIGIVFQYNRFGPPRASSWGNNLKDRSAGTVIRFNWFEGGARQCDLVEADNSGGVTDLDPSYAKTYVYGNIFIKGSDSTSSQVIHYGGDLDGAPTYLRYRQGTLYFYNNTVVSRRVTAILGLDVPASIANVRNNIIYSVSGAGEYPGIITLSGTANMYNNWIWANPDPNLKMHDLYKTPQPGDVPGTVNWHTTTLEGSSIDAVFVDHTNNDFRLKTGSPCIGSGGSLSPDVSAYPLNKQYKLHQKSESRSDTSDIGGFAR